MLCSAFDEALHWQKAVIFSQEFLLRTAPPDSELTVEPIILDLDRLTTEEGLLFFVLFEPA